MTSTHDAIISATNVSAAYARKAVLQDISFAVQRSSVTSVLGQNGAGKTSLLRILAGVLPVSAGTLALDGLPLNACSPDQRAARIAYVPQHVEPGLPLSALEAVQIAAQCRVPAGRRGQVEAREIAAAALSESGAEQFAGREITKLSAGQQRRVMIAQGLAQLRLSAGVLLLDEPTAFLDPHARLELLDALAGWSQRLRITVVMALHEPELAQHYSQQLLLLREGRLLYAGCPGHAATAALERLYQPAAADMAVPSEGVNAHA